MLSFVQSAWNPAYILQIAHLSLDQPHLKGSMATKTVATVMNRTEPNVWRVSEETRGYRNHI